MGLRISQLFTRFFQKSGPEVRVVMLGLDNAGKTTILYQLKLDRNVQPLPTIGFNVETVRCGKMLLSIWDISGAQPRTRTLWQHYNQNARAIIFVIDSADIDRLPRVIEELNWLWLHKDLAEAAFLIFANKQDLPDALHAADLVTVLRLQAVPRPWSVQECCAISGAGLWDGIQQLQQMLTTTGSKRSSVKLRSK